MPSTPSINAVQTRVVANEDGFFPQMSTDGLTWFAFDSRGDDEDSLAAIQACKNMGAWTSGTPEQGKVIWRSKA